MPLFQVIRCEKRKAPDIVKMQGHNDRLHGSYSNPDIDLSRSFMNETLIDCGNMVDVVAKRVAEAQANQKRKIRADAPHALEFVITASPEAIKNWDEKTQKEYFTDALEFLKKRHGAENVIHAVIHRDESTPHMHVVVIPMHERKLNAKHFTGREDLRTLQDNFHDQVAKKYALARGEPSSRKHKSVADYKRDADAMLEASLNPSVLYPEPMPRRGLRLAESATEYRQRLIELGIPDAVKARVDRANRALLQFDKLNRDVEIHRAISAESVQRTQAAEKAANESASKMKDMSDELSLLRKERAKIQVFFDFISQYMPEVYERFKAWKKAKAKTQTKTQAEAPTKTPVKAPTKTPTGLER